MDKIIWQKCQIPQRPKSTRLIYLVKNIFVRLGYITWPKLGLVRLRMRNTPLVELRATGMWPAHLFNFFFQCRLENSKGPESNIQDMKNFLAFPSFFFISLGIKILRTISWNFPIRTYCGYSNFTFLPKSPFIYQITYIPKYSYIIWPRP